ELTRAVLDKHVELLERALVEQEFKPLARGELATLVLRLDAVFPAARARLRAARFELFENVLHCASNPASGTPWKFLSCCPAGANAPGMRIDGRASCFGVRLRRGAGARVSCRWGRKSWAGSTGHASSWAGSSQPSSCSLRGSSFTAPSSGLIGWLGSRPATCRWRSRTAKRL